ncbi:MAG: hypothetical protein HKL96_13920 [Phycisphaerales bacterium]|nr:hypothetical protein [Phycisphaerales bacterium]
MQIAKYSFGIGDRFGRQGKAQLAAFMEYQKAGGAAISPVWNKSNREHNIVHTEPPSVRIEADAAVKALGFTGAYHVDADHIGLATVERFLACSDFFTMDVADLIGKPATASEIDAFSLAVRPLIGSLSIGGIAEPVHIAQADVAVVAQKYLAAVKEAGRIYRHIAGKIGGANFIPEISMDETSAPQTPREMFLILAAIAAEQIPIQTIAPKFTGRFNKGVDYHGDVAQFAKEFADDVAVIAYAVKHLGLPTNLKLSVHSGSDKFSIYEPIRQTLAATGAGLHIKTAGTTWLEEVIGLAMAEGRGLQIAKKIYAQALQRCDELCAPYATVIDIDRSKLPTSQQVANWSSAEYVAALQHDPKCPAYNANMRQLIHVGFKVAAQLGDEYLGALSEFEGVIARNVTGNILHRHMERIFPRSA